MKDKICEVCNKEFDPKEFYFGEGYDYKCPNCGALYAYDEGDFLQLGEVVKYDAEKNEITFKLKRII